MQQQLLQSAMFKTVKEVLSKKWVQVGLLFLFAAILRFYPFLLGKTLVFGDNYSLMVPGKLFTVHWIKQGIFPLWNPNIFAGLPWIGDVNQSVLYPSTLLFAVFHPAIALNLTIVLHLLLTFVGMYLFLRLVEQEHFYSLLGGVMWMLSTQVADSIHNLSTIQSIAWFPWIAWLALKVRLNWKYKFLFAAAVTLQFAAGYPQHVIYAILLGVFLSLVFKDLHPKSEKKKTFLPNWLGHWIITAFLTVGLSAIIWLPFYELLINSTRIKQTVEQAASGSLNPAMMIRLLISYFFDKQTAGYKWGPAWSGPPNVLFYLTWFGLLALILPLKKKFKKLEYRFQNKILFAGSIFTLIFALGSYLPGFSFLQKAIPLFKVGRYPSMTLILTTFLLILLFVRRLPKIRLSLNLKRKLLGIGLIIFTIGFMFWILSLFNFSLLWSNLDNWLGNRLNQSVFHTLARDKVILINLLENLVVVSSLFLLSLILWVNGKKRLLLVIFVLDLVYVTQGMFIFAPNKVYDKPKTDLKVDFAQARLLTRNSNKPYTDYGSYWEALIVRSPFSDSFVDEVELISFSHPQRLKAGLTPDWNMAKSVPVIHGYTTLLPLDFAKIWQKSDEPRINFLDYIDLEKDSELLKQWSVGYYLVDNWFDVGENLDKLDKIQKTDHLELYSLPALSRFRYADGSFSKQAPLDLTISENPNQIDLSFTNEDAKNLIIADRYDKDWVARVNDERVEIKNFQEMRLIPIQPGKNQVVLVYRPTNFYLGGLITAVTTAIGLAGVVTRKRSE